MCPVPTLAAVRPVFPPSKLESNSHAGHPYAPPHQRESRRQAGGSRTGTAVDATTRVCSKCDHCPREGPTIGEAAALERMLKRAGLGAI